jgi:hypothetical protein
MRLHHSDRVLAFATAVFILGAPRGAAAQSASSTASSVSRGFGVSATSLETPVSPLTHDVSGTTSFVNGVLQAPAGSLFSAVPSPALSLTGGVGASGNTSANVSILNAAAGRLDVITPKPSSPSADSSLVLNGKVDLDGGY